MIRQFDFANVSLVRISIDPDFLNETIKDVAELYSQEPTEERRVRLLDMLLWFEHQTGRVHELDGKFDF